MPVSGSKPAPVQLAPPDVPGICTSPCLPPGRSSIRVGGVNSGPYSKPSRISSASCRNSGVKSIRSSAVTPCWSNAGGFVGNGWVGDVRSPGTVDCGTGRSSIGHTGSPVARSKTYVNACLLTIATASIARPSTVMSTRFGADAKS